LLLLACTGVLASALDSRAFASGELLPAKVVRQYALTSANDFPQRDPLDWRLLGSNDGGKSWNCLDERKGVIFSERHQRKLFKIPNQIAFNLYRLEFDRVREPSQANSVQLAEIEPLGETEDDLDPAPLFADLITAQGENPNLEGAFSAFDGRIKTKWLDFADQNPATRASWIQWQYTDHKGLIITNFERLAELRSQAAHGYAARINGWVVGRSKASGQWCLMDTTGSLMIQDAQLQSNFSPGQHVCVEGISCATGRRAGLAQPRLIQVGPTAPSVPAPMALEEPLSQGEMRWVQVEGQIRFVGRSGDGLSLEVADKGRSVSVRVLRAIPTEALPSPGMRVQVSGVCEGVLSRQGQSVAGIVWVATQEAISPLESVSAQVPPSASPSPTGAGNQPSLPLTTIDQVRQLSPEKLTQKPIVRLRGVVTDLYGTYIEDETGGIEIRWSPDKAPLSSALGDYVSVEGTGDWVEGDSPAVQVDTVRFLGKGELPLARPSSWSELSSGRGLDQWVEIQGVVHSSDGSHVLLDCEGEQALVTIRSAPAPQVDKLVDATVRMRGVGTTARDEHQVRGIHLIVPSLEFVEVDQPPMDVSSLPVRDIGSLLRGNGPKAIRHRIKIEGVLTLQEGGRYFIQDATGSAMAVAKQSIVLTRSGHWVFWQSARSLETLAGPQLQPGNRLEAVGFPDMRGHTLVLTEAILRPQGRSTPLKPVRADANGIFAGNLDSTLVSLEAVLLSQNTIGRKTTLELRDGQKVFEAFVRGPVLSVAPGSRVRVTGICQTEPTPYEAFGESVSSFKLLVGSEADVVVLKRPPWWDFKHTLAVTSALTAVLAVAICWIWLLRRQVEKRTTQLQREIQERKRIELEMERSHKHLLQASRLAGMAEVATNVLHNVGNVLNSVNVLGWAIVEDVHNSSVSSVKKLADLLAFQGQDFGRFITDDPRGQKLPDYLKRLSGHLALEQSDLIRKVESLTENIQHIKEIVATQQTYAKVAGVWEKVSPEDIVEDALRMQGEGLARHNIRLMRDYKKAPSLLADRHKLLQILFNLLQNAKHACYKSDAAERQVTVRIRARNEQCVEISVQDNGIGIAPENLARIFAQGFSTRKGGHGFGLHSSVLMAQDMGGSLRAYSDGPGKGATFVLELPLTPKADHPNPTAAQAPLPTAPPLSTPDTLAQPWQ
jgi:signal transduction histidine kinase